MGFELEQIQMGSEDPKSSGNNENNTTQNSQNLNSQQKGVGGYMGANAGSSEYCQNTPKQNSKRKRHRNRHKKKQAKKEVKPVLEEKKEKKSQEKSKVDQIRENIDELKYTRQYKEMIDEDAPDVRPDWEFTYPILEISKGCFKDIYEKELATEIIPYRIMKLLLPLVPHEKSYAYYITYLNKAYRDEGVMKYFKMSSNNEELLERKLKVHRFYWRS